MSSNGNRFIRWLHEFRDVDCAERIVASHIHDYQRHLSNVKTAKGLPLKPSTINHGIQAAKALLGWLYERGRLVRPLQDFLHRVREPQLLPTSVLKHQQVQELIAVIDTSTPAGLRDRALVELLYSTGIRVGEVEGTRINDLDLDAGVLRVMGKGQKERLVPVGQTARRYLTSYLRAGRSFFSDLNPGVREIFLTSQGLPLRQHRIRMYLHRYAQAAGLEDHQKITPHTLRRSCTTEMVRANANLYHVKEILGHASLNTLKHYAKLRRAGDAKAAEGQQRSGNINDLKATHSRCHPREKDEQ